MKIILVLLGSLLVLRSNSNAVNFNLKVNITGFPSNEGKAYVALFRKGDKFPEIKGEYIGKIISIENKKAEIIFTNLPKNSYAIAVFHDKNKNGKLDKNILGIPTEHYGFSNNARETFSAPSFESAAIKLNTFNDITIHIK